MRARNWRGGGGELDLVVAHDGKLRFVEVKLRRSRDTLSDDAVAPRQRLRLLAAAEAWLEAHGNVDEACFLLATVDPSVEPWSIVWMDDPF